MTTTKATIWVRIENCETEKVRIDAELDIDDLKKKLLGKDANKYRAIYQNTCLRSDAAIPIGTTFEQPISLCLEHAPNASNTQFVLPNVDSLTSYQSQDDQQTSLERIDHDQRESIHFSRTSNQQGSQACTYDSHYFVPNSLHQSFNTLTNARQVPPADYFVQQLPNPVNTLPDAYVYEQKHLRPSISFQNDQRYHSLPVSSTGHPPYYAPTAIRMPSVVSRKNHEIKDFIYPKRPPWLSGYVIRHIFTRCCVQTTVSPAME
ncbi:unnamed protein product [Rotaria magnacalcarata]|uniref:Ubiquitin-like domain-containing protein n=1 Tax=Rotaria magnacalcarata TaxID=392030 RepID=A0A816RJU9_9BILA|nr:unnamed protein product [Rotaria magnacalcarata]CAF2074795.1 unnamed protein product [Rotaria magnacalcarata]CAF3888105.1 unnamed protein product [Rotaria magnacalcarata]CAF3975928.1 unnamed protein product [Rotaria magnacalcarata]